MADIIKEIVPFAYEAFEDHILNSMSFSGKELDLICKVFNDSGCLQEQLLDLFQGQDYKKTLNSLVEKLNK